MKNFLVPLLVVLQVNANHETQNFLMELKFIDHALEQLKERKIFVNEVEITLIEPDFVVRQNGKLLVEYR